MEQIKQISDPVLAAVQVEAAQINSNGTSSDVFTSELGIKFKVKAVNRQSLGGMTDRYLKEKPKPPVVFIESKGREEANYDDPDYQDALQSWNLSMSMALSNFIILRGAELIESSIPANVMRYDSDDWIYEMELISDKADNPRACYLEWVRAIACSEEDSKELFSRIGKKSGINQEDVNSAAAQFRS